jgi:hypothetical protein
MLLLAQEFSLDNVIRIWDTILADHDKFTFLNFICVALVTVRREKILANEFGECLEMLQKSLNNCEPSFVAEIIQAAKRICLKVTRKYENYIEE